MTSLETLRNTFKDFYEKVKSGHETTKLTDHRGHGFDHDITVATLAYKIAPSKELGMKAWCAALLHSTDRVVDASLVRDTMVSYAKNLKHIFNEKEINEIVEAAMRHSETNQNDQNDVQVILMDADRLANMQMAVVIRAGQFRNELPVLDLKYLRGEGNPLSTYENPKTILDNLRLVIKSYIPQLRTEKAKGLGKMYGERLQDFIKAIEEDYRYLDLLDAEL